ncbi:hypothetical protein D881_06100 [Corynebacterium ulcerans NCTC 12077]|nr:hypothetical protein D881_06100 [Corynebacterium ulcerans NCTC 12077]
MSFLRTLAGVCLQNTRTEFLAFSKNDKEGAKS